MRNTDPFEFFQDHRETIFRCLGVAGVLLVVFLLLRMWARRHGGWRAAWAKVRRQAAVTRHAYAAPFRAWHRYRRSLRLLVRLLGTPATWRDAERALAAARLAAAPACPYAVLVDEETVTVLLTATAPVLLTATAPPAPADPWWSEPGEPDRWVIMRADLPAVTPDAAAVRPVLVALGEEGDGPVRSCAFLDLAVGPAQFPVTGDQRSATALLQAIGAQLDARLPEGLLVVAEGVHRDHPGPPVRNAYRTARELRPVEGIAPHLVAAGLPDPLPPELTAPPDGTAGPRLVVLGPGRGHVRTLLTDRHSRVAVIGTPLLPSATALSAAIARVLPRQPT